MPPWGYAPEPPACAVGDIIFSGEYRGRVVSVGADAIGVVWSDGDGGTIVYPADAPYLRKAMPWET